MIPALARAPVARLLRSGRTAASVLAWCGIAAALAVAAREGGWVHGADRVLIGPYGSLVLPLLAYTVVGAVLGSKAFATSVAPLVALGAPPARAILAAMSVAVFACAALGAALGVTVALVAHGAGDPSPLRDATASAYAAGLGGAAYAAWFSLGAAMVRGGVGRAGLLVADWVIGAGDGATAVLAPRAHVRNLLGGPPPIDLAQSTSAAALVVIILACALLAGRRARRLAAGAG
jgi:hypothetical protein